MLGGRRGCASAAGCMADMQCDGCSCAVSYVCLSGCTVEAVVGECIWHIHTDCHTKTPLYSHRCLLCGVWTTVAVLYKLRITTTDYYDYYHGLHSMTAEERVKLADSTNWRVLAGPLKKRNSLLLLPRLAARYPSNYPRNIHLLYPVPPAYHTLCTTYHTRTIRVYVLESTANSPVSLPAAVLLNGTGDTCLPTISAILDHVPLLQIGRAHV